MAITVVPVREQKQVGLTAQEEEEEEEGNAANEVMDEAGCSGGNCHVIPRKLIPVLFMLLLYHLL